MLEPNSCSLFHLISEAPTSKTVTRTCIASKTEVFCITVVSLVFFKPCGSKLSTVAGKMKSKVDKTKSKIGANHEQKEQQNR